MPGFCLLGEVYSLGRERQGRILKLGKKTFDEGRSDHLRVELC